MIEEDPSIFVPVMLVHGWGGSFETTWCRSGFTELLADAGRSVIGVDLLGHGTAPKPHEPGAYTDLTGRIVDQLPEGTVDAVGFSLGALSLLQAAILYPGRFRRLVLAGIGRNVFEHDAGAIKAITDAIERGPDHIRSDESDTRSRLFAQYASHPGNDPIALSCVLRRPPPRPPTAAELAGVSCPVLVINGDQDFVLPADRLVEELGNSTLRILRRTDHFATPESFDFIDAALEFLDAIPS